MPDWMGQTLFTATAATIFCIALYNLIIQPDFFRKIIAVNILGTSVFLYLVVFAETQSPIDHIAHAIVLTGIVVTVAGTALALRLYQRWQAAKRLMQEHGDQG